MDVEIGEHKIVNVGGFSLQTSCAMSRVYLWK